MEEVTANYWEVFGSHLASLVDLHDITSALDVGTGWGDCLIPLAKKIGSKGEIVGIDIQESAVRKTRLELNKLSMTNVSVEVMDATNLKFQENFFDVITCGFIGFNRYYNFENNTFRQDQNNPLMKEMHRVLKNQGIIVLSTWKLQEDLEIVAEMAHDPSKFPGYSKEHEQGITFLMQDAGFTDIQIEVIDYCRVYDSLDDWWKNKSLIIARDPNCDSYLAKYERNGRLYFKKSVIYAKGKKEINPF